MLIYWIEKKKERNIEAHMKNKEIFHSFEKLYIRGVYTMILVANTILLGEAAMTKI